ncbi:DUF7287 family protein [Halovenus salina]|uniref:Class III signal peptide-containing protein n=1 Tax=Halovenus salina TaxID=1510225 RepID=A0ABD5VXC2_9EURY|nr:hypothetical protein [Halovenus salina]
MTRGQTVTDYLLGIVLLLLSVTIVFGYFPGLFQPFEENVEDEERVMADNLAAELIDNSTIPGMQQTASFNALNRTIDTVANDSTGVGVPEWLRWNATVQNETGVVESGGVTLANGSVWNGRQTASVVRFVRIPSVCENGCRLVVRVW